MPEKRGVDLGTETFRTGATDTEVAVQLSHPAAAYRSNSSSMWHLSLAIILGGFFMPKSSIFSIFAPKYWMEACSEFRDLRSLVFAGLTIALGTILSFLSIPVGVNLRITTAFLALALGSMIFGPVVGLSAGLAYDLIGYLFIPATVFFPGYTLSSMLEFFLYGIFLYRRKITVLRVFLCKFLVDFGIHVGLGCLWSSILFDKGYYYFLIKSLIKNTIMLPIEVLMLLSLLQIALPVLAHQGMITKPKNKFIPLI